MKDSDPLSQFWQLKDGVNSYSSTAQLFNSTEETESINMQQEVDITNDEVFDESMSKVEEAITPQVGHCTGCGVKLQTENKR